MSVSIQVRERNTQGASGFSGASGWSGMAGAFTASGFSGYSGVGGPGPSGQSGFSGPSAQAYNWTTRAYKQLDEVRDAYQRFYYPPPEEPYPIPPADSELNIALEANNTYFIDAVLLTECFTNTDLAGTYPTNTDLESMWSYTGTVNNLSISFIETGGALVNSVISNVWTDVNNNYPGPVHPVTDWSLWVAGSNQYPYNTGLTIRCSGTIETNTAGVLSFCWIPYFNYEKPPYGPPGHPPYALPAGFWLRGTIKRGSYLQANNFSTGAASGVSGFSGKTNIVMVGSWLGI
jgi:flagellin-like hook-associated protein FlgL